MGFREIKTWVMVRRFDKLENDTLETNLQELTLSTALISDELKAAVLRSIQIENDENRIIKVRSPNNNLIPLSTLLNGSSKESPFIVDVVQVHQFCPVETRTILPGYIEALKSNLSNLENRIKIAEKTLPDLTTAHMILLNEETNQLSTCISFLDRRLDQLVETKFNK